MDTIFELSSIYHRLITEPGGGERGVVKRWMIEFETPPPPIHLALFRHGFKDKRKEKRGGRRRRGRNERRERLAAFHGEETERERERVTENFRGGSQLKAPPGSKEVGG